ncbi:unnamed protein product [Mycena citricolor]|uniref:tRNase Z endonuclease domain-containing protein n=1 Tax=Mycena citricolor TaxID=2018698 RepID=A0AAD2HI05_9AGAR|nr:unnamed protein product [Mycena citricolor]
MSIEALVMHNAYHLLDLCHRIKLQVSSIPSQSTCMRSLIRSVGVISTLSTKHILARRMASTAVSASTTKPANTPKSKKSDKDNAGAKAPLDMEVTFLGTASAQPSSTRVHSSLAFRLSADVWLFDCGEGTQSRLQKSAVKMGKIEKIFLTHLHGAHYSSLSLKPTDCLLGGHGGTDGAEDVRSHIDVNNPIVEFTGHWGHADPPNGDHCALPRHRAESPFGRNIPQIDGVWSNILENGSVSVSAAPIYHSVPCIGYVITEKSLPGKMDPKKYIPELKRTNTPIAVMSQLQQGNSVELTDGTILHGPPRKPGRKVVILGDTNNPSPIASMAMDADLLIHEATNAHLPGIESEAKESDTFQSVEKRTRSRGHSTPQMAGAFAKRIRAKRLILNHFSARYRGDDDVDESAKQVMTAIGNLAAEEYGQEVTCARDLMAVTLPPPP